MSHRLSFEARCPQQGFYQSEPKKPPYVQKTVLVQETALNPAKTTLSTADWKWNGRCRCNKFRDDALVLKDKRIAAVSHPLVPVYKNFQGNLRPDFSAQQSAEICGNLHQVAWLEREAGLEKMGQIPENVCGRVLVTAPKPNSAYAILESAFQHIYKKLVTGWIEAHVDNHPDILQVEDPKLFHLFIKQSGKPMANEDSLLSSIIQNLNLSPNDVKCSNVWITKNVQLNPGRTYLWIRKTALQQVVDKMGLDLSRQPRSRL